jgi:hypothetical protein
MSATGLRISVSLANVCHWPQNPGEAQHILRQRRHAPSKTEYRLGRPAIATRQLSWALDR